MLNPKMQRRDGRLPEHIYPNGSLCLYYPKRGEWTDGMLLADSQLLWAIEWLFHYEVWLATGVWEGGGVHPGRGVR
jgi:hypothetical protein